MLMVIMDEYIDYIEKEKKLSINTIDAYRSDVEKFNKFIGLSGVNKLEQINNTYIIRYLLQLQREKKTNSTISRHLASIRCLFEFLVNNGKVKEDPTLNLKPPKNEKRTPMVLSEDEISFLMSLPDLSTSKGARDKALLELLYSSGLRASEINTLFIGDVNLPKGRIVLSAENPNRIVPVGSEAIKSIAYYLSNYRVESEDNEPLFVNYNGNKLTRQGLWKIIKAYSNQFPSNKSITPQILRNSFAVHILRNGADIKTVQKIMGHSDINSTQAYTMIAKESDVEEVYRKAHPRA